MDSPHLSRRALLQQTTLLGAALLLPRWRRDDPDRERLESWTTALHADKLTDPSVPLGRSAVRVGELAAGSPYLPGTLESYLKAQGDPQHEPLALSLSHFDCVTLVEACIAVSRAAADPIPGWDGFAKRVEQMRYRDGVRSGYTSRLHYFSEWIRDGARRGLVQDLGPQLGGAADTRPLRFMSEHRASYPALVNDAVFTQVSEMERRLDGEPRLVVAPDRVATIEPLLQTGDILAFATAIPGLDVTHAAMTYRDPTGTMRVLHAPLSGGVVEVTRSSLAQYVAAIRRCTGILVARPLRI
jgi:hypothetical protein